MEQLFDAMINSPFWFTVGTFIVLAIYGYRKFMLLFGKKQQVTEVINFTRSKENIMQLKETQEVISFLNDFAYDVVQNLKGPEVMSAKLAKLFAAILADKELQDKFMIALANIKEVPNEAKEITAEDALELAGFILPLVGKWLKK